jgi:hypothetical protein
MHRIRSEATVPWSDHHSQELPVSLSGETEDCETPSRVGDYEETDTGPMCYASAGG